VQGQRAEEQRAEGHAAAYDEAELDDEHFMLDAHRVDLQPGERRERDLLLLGILREPRTMRGALASGMVWLAAGQRAGWRWCEELPTCDSHESSAPRSSKHPISISMTVAGVFQAFMGRA